MSDQAQVRVGGVGFGGLLALLLIGLKLTGYIAWSWIWVLWPIWIPIVLLGIFGVLLGLAAIVVFLLRKTVLK